MTREAALDHVLGYICLNDVSARDLQFGDVQWIRGKSLDTFCSIGPALVTADEVGPSDLAIRCIDRRGAPGCAHLGAVLRGAEMISFCSDAFTLEPGDMIATGTPGGVGVFRDPQRFLRDGDHVAVEIERIGRLENVCRVAVSRAVA